MSFRSQGNFPSNTFANRYFNGGGHLNASGGEGLGTIEETVTYIESILPAFYQEWADNNNNNKEI